MCAIVEHLLCYACNNRTPGLWAKVYIPMWWVNCFVSFPETISEQVVFKKGNTNKNKTEILQ